MFLQVWQQKGNNVRFKDIEVSRKFGSKSHPSHRKQVVARRLSPFSKSWRCFWRIQGILGELGFNYEVQRNK
jgi:hypothetical protein